MTLYRSAMIRIAEKVTSLMKRNTNEDAIIASARHQTTVSPNDMPLESSPIHVFPLCGVRSSAIRSVDRVGGKETWLSLHHLYASVGRIKKFHVPVMFWLNELLASSLLLVYWGLPGRRDLCCSGCWLFILTQTTLYCSKTCDEETEKRLLLRPCKATVFNSSFIRHWRRKQEGFRWV